MSKEEKKELPLIKHLLDKIGDSDIVPTRKVTTIAGESKIKRMIAHKNKIVGCLYEDDNIIWFDMPEAEEAKKLLEDE
jgi:N-acetylglutamate synthase-like GNAT family acetyltransferase